MTEEEMKLKRENKSLKENLDHFMKLWEEKKEENKEFMGKLMELQKENKELKKDNNNNR